jgi:Zn-dependent protease
MHQPAQTACPHCGASLQYGEFTCPTCGAPANLRQLDDLAAEALRLEPVNPPAAAMVWRQTLALLPQGSPQYQQIEQRASALAAGWVPPGVAVQPRVQPGWSPGMREVPHAAGSAPRAVRPPDPMPVALLKTFGSMIVAAAVYYFYPFHDWTIAIGFVVLMLIHEMGHVFATWYYGLSASPPIFIPYLGALINLREPPPNALVESVIGIGGPLLGTLGAVACYFVALSTSGANAQRELLVVAQLAFLLNLFNLLPVPPMDGGRITAAVSPWIWIAGLAGLALLIVNEVLAGAGSGLIVLLLLLFYALPRIIATFRARGMKIPYYNIPRAASWTMGLLYVGLGVFLAFMFHHLHGVALLESGIR